MMRRKFPIRSGGARASGSLRKWFTVPSLLQLLLTIALIGFFLIRAGIGSYQLILKELQQQMLRQVGDQLSERMHTALHLNQVHCDLLKYGVLDLSDQDARERYFVSHIRAHPDVATTFIGLPDGSFYGARRAVDGQILVARNDKSTGGISRYYSVDETGSGQAFVEAFPDFDARTRPWYTGAAAAGAPTFTEIYSHFTFHQPTITASQPVYDQNDRLIGVFGVNYLLSWLGDTLDSLPIGASGQVFVTDQNGLLIAASSDSSPYKTVDGVARLVPAAENESPLIRTALPLGQAPSGNRLPSFTLAGREYFVGLSHYQEHGLDWDIYVVSAADDFLSGVDQAVMNTVLILLASLLFSIILSSWIGARVTKPLVTLSRAARELARGNPAQIPDDGRQDELGDLTRAFNEMGSKLTDTLANLEDQVALRTGELHERNLELMQNNELRETFFDADESFIYLKDKDLKYVFVNKALRDFFQRTDAELIGRDDFQLVEEDFARLCTQADLEALEQGRLMTTTTYWKGQYFRTTKFPVRMPDGSFGVGAYIADTTEEHAHRKNREQILRRNRVLLKILNQSFPGKQEQLDYALHELLKLSGSQFGYIYLYDEDKEEFVLNSWTRGVMEQCAVQNPSTTYQLSNTGIWGEVVRQRRPIIVNDFESSNPLKKGYPQGHVALKRFMSVPVTIDGRIVAVVGLANKETDYDDSNVNEMTVLMSGVWNAVQRRDAEETLVLERNKYYQTLLSIGDGVMVIDRNKNVEFLNAVACRLTGWTLAEARGVPYKQVFALTHEQEGFTIDDPIEGVFSTGLGQELGNHAMLTAKNGARFHLEDSAAPILDDKGALAGVVLVFRDVTDKKEQRRKIEYMSFHDSLTGLYNRHFFEEELRRADAEHNLPISILMGDVNSLKLTNDIFGHAFGDMLLEKVAEIMQNVCRADDVIARWGGDEFVLLLPRTGSEEVQRIAERIRREVSMQQISTIKCSISIGYDTKWSPGGDLLHILSSAEAKMYSAKTLERNLIQKHELGDIINAFFQNYEPENRHARRVSELCRKFGSTLAIPQSDVQRLAEAGLLHDIGKIIMEPSLLLSCRLLSPTERNDMNQHPVVGYRILNYFDNTLELAEAVLTHHENWDGTGYPKGLKGEKIPLLARVISVVEAYDDMLYARDCPDRKSFDEAAQELRRCAGTQFDPGIVSDFIRWLQSGGAAED